MIVNVHREDARGNVYTLMEELREPEITVPVGFESDGASVPRFFWRFIFPPGDPKALRAAFKHDYIYRIHPADWTRGDADQMFRKNLLEDGVKPWRAALAFIGLRLFGFVAWKQKGGQGTALHPAAPGRSGDDTASSSAKASEDKQPTGKRLDEGRKEGGAA